MQLKFQQSFEFIILHRTPFIVRVLDIAVVPQRQVRTVPNCAGDRAAFTGAVLGPVVDMPVVVQRQAPEQGTGLSRGSSPYVSPRRPSEGFFFPVFFLLALFALGNEVHYFLMASNLAVTLPVSGCCLRSTEKWILREILRLLGRSAWLDSGYMFCITTWRFWSNCTHFLRRSGLEF